MEHLISQWFDNRNFYLSTMQVEQLTSYAVLIHTANQNFNITGFKTLQEVTENLVFKSIEPHLGLIVPHGTTFVDLGTGGGVPGIPLGIVFPHMSGLLIDSNNKRIGFIDKVVSTLNINNIRTRCCRIEECAHEVDCRESFDYAFSRALADPYIVIELGAALIKVGGFVFIYSSNDALMKQNKYQTHAHNMGLQRLTENEINLMQWSSDDMAWKKNAKTHGRYPRRYPVMKREAERYLKVANTDFYNGKQ